MCDKTLLVLATWLPVCLARCKIWNTNQTKLINIFCLPNSERLPCTTGICLSSVQYQSGITLIAPEVNWQQREQRVKYHMCLQYPCSYRFKRPGFGCCHVFTPLLAFPVSSTKVEGPSLLQNSTDNSENIIYMCLQYPCSYKFKRHGFGCFHVVAPLLACPVPK